MRGGELRTVPVAVGERPYREAGRQSWQLLLSFSDPGFPFGLEALSAHLAERAARLRPSVVSIHRRAARPRRRPERRGVIWQADGLIVTNAHVVDQPRAHVIL